MGDLFRMKVAATFHFTRIDVDPGVKTAAAVSWEAVGNISQLL